jgi:predicted enzyme related to lactoylglutathione lyase
MITHVAFTACPVREVARSRRFYEEVLGLKLTQEFNNEWVEYDLGDTTFVITTADEAHPAGGKGVAVAFEVSNLDEFLAKLRRHAVESTNPVMETPICRSAIIGDPDGNELIIHERKAR